MINPFDETPAEKEENVLDMVRRGYSYQQIMKTCHVSPNDITRIKREHGLIGNNTSNNTGKISKETQALIMFGKGKGLFEVATELDIDADDVFVIYQKFQRLRNNETFISMYERVKGNMHPFFQLFEIVNGLRLSPAYVGQLAALGTRLPLLGNIYSNLCRDIQILNSQRGYLGLQVNNAQNHLEQFMASLAFYGKECETKRNELDYLNSEIDKKKTFIQNLDNQEGYQRIKKESTEQTKSIIKNNPLLMAVTVSSTVEAIRRYPNNQQLFYDLWARQGYSALSQETWMRSHTTQLLQLSEQVQIEIAEQITKMVVSKIQENDSSAGGTLVVSHGQTPPAMTTKGNQSLANKI
jgi:hypothetical protein